MSLTLVKKAPKIPNKIVECVDVYLSLHEQIKTLEKQMKPYREVVEGFMESAGVTELPGNNGGLLKQVEVNFKTYSPAVVKRLCPESVSSECIQEVVDKKKFEALVTLGRVSKKIAKEATIIDPRYQLRVSKYNSKS